MAISKNLIPQMTSDTTPSPYVASASAYYSNSTYSWNPYKAFNHTSSPDVVDDSWVVNDLIGWLQFKFDSSVKVSHYVVVAKGYSNGAETQSPKDWTFEGSNDGSTYDILHTVTGEINWTSAERRSFTFENSSEYLYYRINITANNGDTTYLSIGELEMMEVIFSNKILISFSDGSYKSIIPTTYGSSDYIPIMTSNNAPSPFVVSASSEYSTSTPAWKLFDSVDTSYWMSDNLGNVNSWISVSLDEDVTIGKYTISMFSSTNTTYYTRMPKDWLLEGSNTGLFTGEQVVIDERIGETGWTDGEKREYKIESPQKFKYYRLFVNVNNGDVNYSNIGEIELFKVKSFESVKSIPFKEEQNFINHGMDISIELDLSQQLERKSFIDNTSSALGSGKVFSKSVDTTQMPIKKVQIK